MARSHSVPGLVRPYLLNTFICFHLLVVAAWLAPSNWLLRNKIVEVTGPYVLGVGLGQSWGLFAPTPVHLNGYLDAQVELADGRTITWTFPRMQDFGFLERYQKERYRKWVETVWKDENRIGWPDTARYVARAMARQGLTPVTISLRRNWAYIPPPEEGLGRPLPRPNQQYVFFTYRVKPEDLR